MNRANSFCQSAACQNSKHQMSRELRQRSNPAHRPRSPRKLFPWHRRRDVFHTVSQLTPILKEGDRVLDVGCGYGEVAWLLSGWHVGELWTVDIADYREVITPNFKLYNGLDLPFDDCSFDVILMAFVLHHVPVEHKAALLREARRVTRRTLVVIEDTPRSGFDRLMCHLHGEEYRNRIKSEAKFGFFDQEQWKKFFRDCGLKVITSRPCGRFCRSPIEPFARTTFILEREASSDTEGATP